MLFLWVLLAATRYGAKIVSEFRKNGECTKEEGERMIAFTNNSGPLFIIGTVGVSFFGDTTTGMILFITHLLACISVGILFRFWKRDRNTGQAWKPAPTTQNVGAGFHTRPEPQNSSLTLGEMLERSIKSATNTILLIGGFIVLFSVIISILKESHLLDFCSNLFSSILHTDADMIKPILTGLLELTNGLKELADIHTRSLSINITFCTFLLGFGGISILLQVYSIISKTDLSIKPYILGKLLHGILATFYTYIAITNFKFLNLDLAPVFAPIHMLYAPVGVGIFHFPILFLLGVFLFLFFTCRKIRV